MMYQSTRDHRLQASSTRAVLNGIAPDGGLYILDDLNDLNFDWLSVLEQDPMDMSASILAALLPEFPDMNALVHQGYEGKFSAPDLTPVIPVADRYVLELFRGPTSAFKDVALSLLPRLMTAARDVEGSEEEIVILTATSGDTGKAALEGFRDVPGTRIIVFYPYNGVSPIQQAQMTTQQGKNVCVCAVRGNFDDAQTGVKEIFTACSQRDLGHVRLSSANSINIGRLAPQIAYYFKSYADLVHTGRIKPGQPVHFVVPTGNFGDILAGYFAKLLGLPVGRLICASNANNVLTDFLTTGVYDKRRPFHKTTSPSMDILVSSNLERLLYLLSGCDNEYVRSLMKQLKREGHYQVSEEMLSKLKAEFGCGCCNDAEAAAVIRRVWKESGYLLDPHTAVAWAVADQFMAQRTDDAPVVVLSTASPYKFPAAVLSALGKTPCEDAFALMEQLHQCTGVPVPENLASLADLPVRHRDVIDREKMLDYVLEKVGEAQW